LKVSEALAWIVGIASERVSDSDISLTIDVETGHPSIEVAGRIGALLIELKIAVFVEGELVPSHTSAATHCVDRVKARDPFVAADPPIDKALHQVRRRVSR
jgi:hypothetical protein